MEFKRTVRNLFSSAIILMSCAQNDFALTQTLDPKSVIKEVKVLSEKDRYPEALSVLNPLLKSVGQDSSISRTENQPLLRTAFRLAAYLHLQQKQYSEAEEYLRQLYRSPGYRLTDYEEDYAQVITRDTLFLWNSLMLQGKQHEATQLLEQEITEAIRKQNECYLDFAKFLTMKLDEVVFLGNSQSSVKKCRHFAAGSQALKYFWVAQRYKVAKNSEKIRKHLILFLAHSTKEDFIERGVAFHQLNVPIENRLNYISNATKSDECVCALGVR